MAEEAGTSSGRPRRSTRVPARILATITVDAEPKAATKRTRPEKGKEKANGERLRVLLHEPKSALTRLDMNDVINYETWSQLSSAARAHLVTLLPPTAFRSYQPTLDATHPLQRWRDEGRVPDGETHTAGPSAPTIPELLEESSASTFSCPTTEPMTSDGPELWVSSSPLTEIPSSSRPPSPTPHTDTDHDIDPSFFTDSHFLSAMRTFQDQLYTGWMTEAHMKKVKTYEDRVRNGTMHAPWKDEVWEAENGNQEEDAVVAAPQVPESNALAGPTKEWRLQDLVKQGIVIAGDVLAYRRHFVQAGIMVEKDVYVETVHPKSLSVLLPAGTTTCLPAHVLIRDPELDGETLRSTQVTSPTQLENAILDLDGRLDRKQRPHANAWKTFVVWRWREDGTMAGEERGGREKRNTLFYLRSCSYYDQ